MTNQNQDRATIVVGQILPEPFASSKNVSTPLSPMLNLKCKSMELTTLVSGVKIPEIKRELEEALKKPGEYESMITSYELYPEVDDIFRLDVSLMIRDWA